MNAPAHFYQNQSVYGLSEARHDGGQYINQKIEEQKVLNKVINHVYVNNNSLKLA